MAGITLSGTYGSTVQLNDPLNQNPVTLTAGALIAGALIGLTNRTGINGNGAAAWTIDNSGSFTLGFSDPGLAGHFAISSDGTGGTKLSTRARCGD